MESGFVWGVASASFQVEGATSLGGRCPSVWDTFTSSEGNVANGDHAHVAVDFYHRYPEDIQVSGCKHYAVHIYVCVMTGG